MVSYYVKGKLKSLQEQITRRLQTALILMKIKWPPSSPWNDFDIKRPLPNRILLQAIMFQPYKDFPNYIK